MSTKATLAHCNDEACSFHLYEDVADEEERYDFVYLEIDGACLGDKLPEVQVHYAPGQSTIVVRLPRVVLRKILRPDIKL